MLLDYVESEEMALFSFSRYTVLKSPNKEETAVHGCGPTLSVSFLLVSRSKVSFFT